LARVQAWAEGTDPCRFHTHRADIYVHFWWIKAPGWSPPGLWGSLQGKASGWLGGVGRCAALRIWGGWGAESLPHRRRSLQLCSAGIRDAERKVAPGVF